MRACCLLVIFFFGFDRFFKHIRGSTLDLRITLFSSLVLLFSLASCRSSHLCSSNSACYFLFSATLPGFLGSLSLLCSPWGKLGKSFDLLSFCVFLLLRITALYHLIVTYFIWFLKNCFRYITLFFLSCLREEDKTSPSYLLMVIVFYWLYILYILI